VPSLKFGVQGETSGTFSVMLEHLIRSNGIGETGAVFTIVESSFESSRDLKSGFRYEVIVVIEYSKRLGSGSDDC
jgi:hypothetical protein